MLAGMIEPNFFRPVHAKRAGPTSPALWRLGLQGGGIGTSGLVSTIGSRGAGEIPRPAGENAGLREDA